MNSKLRFSVAVGVGLAILVSAVLGTSERVAIAMALAGAIAGFFYAKRPSKTEDYSAEASEPHVAPAQTTDTAWTQAESNPAPDGPGDTPDLLRRLVNHAMPAIQFKRVFPAQHPVQSMTFFGGRPRAPKNFEWPRDPQGRAMLFLGQVALADLPRLTKGVQLPSEGCLYFFASQGDGAVRHVSGSSTEWPELDPPQPSMTIEDFSFRIGWAKSVPEVPHQFPTAFPKRQMTPVTTWNYPDAWSVPERFSDAERDALRRYAPALNYAAIQEAHGDGTRTSGVGKPLAARHAAFPHVWLSIEALARKISESCQRALKDNEWHLNSAADGLKRPDATERQRKIWQLYQKSHAPMKAELEQLKAQADKLVPVAAKRPPLQPLSDKGIKVLQTLLDRSAEVTVKAREAKLSFLLNSYLDEIAKQIITACAADPHAHALLTKHQIDFARKDHASYVVGDHDYSTRQHQMLGYPANIQGAADGYPHTQCLMQFFYDQGQDWYFGDMGTIQFWMTPEQIVDGHWGMAKVTHEAH